MIDSMLFFAGISAATGFWLILNLPTAREAKDWPHAIAYLIPEAACFVPAMRVLFG